MQVRAVLSQVMQAMTHPLPVLGMQPEPHKAAPAALAQMTLNAPGAACPIHKLGEPLTRRKRPRDAAISMVAAPSADLGAKAVELGGSAADGPAAAAKPATATPLADMPGADLPPVTAPPGRSAAFAMRLYWP